MKSPAQPDAQKPASEEREMISREGRQRLQDEQTQLYTVERPKVVATVSAAADEGDRSENAEYIYGKKRLREIDHRLGFLSRRLDQVRVTLPPKDNRTVQFLSWVTVEDEEGNERVFRLVGADESDAKIGLISYRSPVGQALMKKEVDDTVRVQTPGGKVEYTIIDISIERPDHP